MADGTLTEPAWWGEVDPVTWRSEDDMQEAKVFAARQVVGYLLNLPSDSRESSRVREWCDLSALPGVLGQVAAFVSDGYDGDVMALASRMIAAGYGQRIGNGVLLSNLYWSASLAGVEEAGFVLRCVREQESRVARARAEIERYT